MSPDELRRLFPGASRSTVARNQAGGLASGPIGKSNSVHVAVAEDEGKAADQVRRLVRFKIFHIREQDSENWHTKHFTDALKEAGVIFDDSPQWCQIEREEIIVDHRWQERTEIEITPI